MGLLALALWVLFVGLTFGGRMLVQLRSTGSTGFKGIGGRPGSVAWLAGVLFVVALGLGVLAPVLDLAGPLEPLIRSGRMVGIVLFCAGLLGTLAAQAAMGASWRVGVDPSEETRLVTRGPFAVVRNPIFAAMVPAFLGLVLLVPNAVAVAAFVALVFALELQVRYVEEPYLLRTHGQDYARYASHVGRFVPGVGRLRSS